jgi:hypothetical protein
MNLGLTSIIDMDLHVCLIMWLAGRREGNILVSRAF